MSRFAKHRSASTPRFDRNERESTSITYLQDVACYPNMVIATNDNMVRIAGWVAKLCAHRSDMFAAATVFGLLTGRIVRWPGTPANGRSAAPG